MFRHCALARVLLAYRLQQQLMEKVALLYTARILNMQTITVWLYDLYAELLSTEASSAMRTNRPYRI